MNTLVAANLACLQQGIDLMGRIQPGTYARACPQVFNSSIGGHIRHSLDHYAAFVAGLPGGEIDYDARRRDAAVENDPQAAAALSRELMAGLEALAQADLERPLRIRMDDGGDSTWSRSTLRRELQFLLSHSIHHYALVVAVASRHGISDFPDGFGVAPSTIHHLERKGA